jgi:hypothetical protein
VGMFSAGGGNNMSGRERLIAGLLLAIAVAGAAVIPRLLAEPATPLGIALGPGPGRSVVRAPAIPKPSRGTAPRRATSPVRQVTPTVQVTPDAPQPTSSSSASRENRTPAPRPAPATVESPTPAPPPPAAAMPRAVGRPTQALPPRRAEAPPGHEKVPPGHEKTPPGLEMTPPGQAKPHPEPGRRSEDRGDLGSGHGRQAPQAPSHSVGRHHGHVGHLAPPPTRSAPPAHEGRSKARPEARGPRGKGSHGPPPQVAHGRGSNGHGPHGEANGRG